ncbi:MAG TPA: hypothetical protein VFG42_04575 [Baekduia sp.]|uniref:hypothetical protein n=1 Tax=Baekduia sp. TaxID=2600305 RepID=UPI002D79078C|nr:hypothetical protein [Baekduia sp.]HET6506039.1 hypothetical protein [Baekduia sp.]
MPVCLDLPGPSRRIRVEPLVLPAPARAPAERDAPREQPEPRPAEREAPEPVPA